MRLTTILTHLTLFIICTLFLPSRVTAQLPMQFASPNKATVGKATDLKAEWAEASGMWHPVGGIEAGLNDTVHILYEFDGYVYAGGEFINAGGDPDANYIARWNGSYWEPCGEGLNSPVWSITAFEGNLYVGGEFVDAGGNTLADYIARWDGSTWHALDVGLNQRVSSIVVLEQSTPQSEPEVYVGGDFTDVGGDTLADYIALWNGTSWLPVGEGLNNSVLTLELHEEQLYAGGKFTDAAGNSQADFLAKWTGSAWEDVGNGLNNWVNDITFHNGNLHVGGKFINAGGNPAADGIAKLSNNSWAALGGGVIGTIYCIESYRDTLWVGGEFNIFGNTSDHIAAWHAGSWSGLQDEIVSRVSSILHTDEHFYIGGSFYYPNGFLGKGHIAEYHSNIWQSLGGGVSDAVLSLAEINGALCVGGKFINAGGIPNTTYIGLLSQNEWKEIDGGLNNWVNDIAPLVWEGVSHIVAGGRFTNAGGRSGADFVSSAWLNSNNEWRWADMSEGFTGDINGEVFTVHNYFESVIIAGGSFPGNYEDPAYLGRNYQAASRWDELAPGMSGSILALEITGGQIFAGGNFVDADGNSNVDYITQIQSELYQPLGNGLPAAVRSLYHDGSFLYAGGDFVDVDGRGNADHIVKWDGSFWIPVGGGLTASVMAIEEYDNRIYAAGEFPSSGGSTSYLAHIEKNNTGADWVYEENLFNGRVLALLNFQNALYVGGEFNTLNGVPSGRLVRYRNIITGISEHELQAKSFELNQNYPNPFNPVTHIRYFLPVKTKVKLNIYNALGQMVQILVNETQSSGSQTVTWDGKDQNGKPVSSGIYFYRLDSGELSKSKKMLLIR